MTHDELVSRAVKWLRDSLRCWCILSESGGGSTSELPDAIGWKDGNSVLIECKISLADLRADLQKPWRKHPDLAVGSFRYYMVPVELGLDARAFLGSQRDSFVPLWGLMICHPGMIKIAWHPRGWHEKWHERRPQISVLGKYYEERMLIATLERIAFHIYPMTLAEFLRVGAPNMREILRSSASKFAHPEKEK